jgi:hypothetical protein
LDDFDKWVGAALALDLINGVQAEGLKKANETTKSLWLSSVQIKWVIEQAVLRGIELP